MSRPTRRSRVVDVPVQPGVEAGVDRPGGRVDDGQTPPRDSVDRGELAAHGQSASAEVLDGPDRPLNDGAKLVMAPVVALNAPMFERDCPPRVVNWPPAYMVPPTCRSACTA